MSHQPERKEKDCLNCGTIVQGRFCQNCGQENIVTHQNFWSLSKHFIYDIFHFDGKFFDTLRFLLFKPGLVAKEYASGKRMKYLDPIRMYLFTSAVFFLILFSFSNINKDVDAFEDSINLSNQDRREMAEKYQERLRQRPNDTVLTQKIELLLDTTRPLEMDDALIDSGSVIGKIPYRSFKEYDSIQQSLPPNERDGWFMRILTKRGIQVNEKYKGNGDRFWRSLLDSFFHKFPYILFISLPFFAGLLKLLYVRRKSFYYSDHAVFTLYHYIFSFILLLIIICAIQAQDILGWDIFGWIAFFLIISWFVYLYKGLRSFYKQTRAKTLAKFFLLIFIGLVLIGLLFVIFFLFTAFQL